MTTPLDEKERPKEPWEDSDKPNIGQHPIDKLQKQQHKNLFFDLKDGEKVDKWVEWWKKNSSGNKGPKKYKRAFYQDNDDPLFLMTGSEPKKGTNRSWGSLRRDALAAPNGYENGHHQEGPLINWAYFKQTPESWERIKNHFLSSNPEAERPVINMSLKSLHKGPFKSFYNNVLNNPEEETVVMNPPKIMRTFSDKLSTFEHLDRNNLPTIPTVDASELIYDGKDEVVDSIGHADEGYILKPTNGTGGNGIREVDDLDEAASLLSTESGIMELISDSYDEDEEEALKKSARQHKENLEGFLDGYSIQTYIPHDSDVRMVAFGDDVVNAERRFSPSNDPRTNLSQIPEWVKLPDKGVEKKLSVYGEVINAISDGRLEHLEIDGIGSNSDEYETLGEGPERLTADIVRSFDPDDYNFDSDLDQPPIKIGVDALETDVDSISHLPEHWQERAMEYREGDRVYFVPELNGNPGSGADVAAVLSGSPEQLSTVHCYNFMREHAGLDPYDIDDIFGTENTDTTEGEVSERVESYFPQDTIGYEEWIDHVSKNLRPSDQEPDRPIEDDPFN